MRRVAAVFGFSILLFLGSVVSSPAVPIISQGTALDSNESCAGPAGCPTVVQIAPATIPAVWQPNGAGVWVSYAQTGVGGASPGNSTLAPVATFSELINVLSGSSVLTLSVWADDTARVLVDGVELTPAGGTAPNFNTDDHCAEGPLGCQTGEQGEFTSQVLAAGFHTLSIEVFQVDGYQFGVRYEGNLTQEGDLTQTPEPASILLFGSAMAAAGMASRRRWLGKRETP